MLISTACWLRQRVTSSSTQGTRRNEGQPVKVSERKFSPTVPIPLRALRDVVFVATITGEQSNDCRKHHVALIARVPAGSGEMADSLTDARHFPPQRK